MFYLLKNKHVLQAQFPWKKKSDTNATEKENGLGRKLGPDLLHNDVRHKQQNVRQLKGGFCVGQHNHIFSGGAVRTVSPGSTVWCCAHPPGDVMKWYYRTTFWSKSRLHVLLEHLTKLTYKTICNPQTHIKKHYSSCKVNHSRIM